MKLATRFAATTAVLALAATGCGTKAGDSGGGADGDVKTGAGVSGNTISLGVLTDLSGPFAPIGKEVQQSLELYWDQRNDDGGVCKKYKVEVQTKDNAYNVQQTSALYSTMSKDVVAFQNVLGTAPSLAIADRLESEEKLAILHGQGAEVLKHPNILMTGTTFPVEAANGLGYLMEKGLLKEGEAVGHIYLEGSYGEGVLAGVEKFTAEHDMSLAKSQIAATTTDLTAAVSTLANKDVKVIVASTSPPQLASVALAAAAEGLDVPILASTPAWTAGLLDTPAAKALTKHMYTAFPVSGFENPAAAKFRDAYVAKYPGQDPSLQIILVYSEALAMDAVLEKACENGDLTPAGVLKAKGGIDTLETDGVTPTLDLTREGVPVTAEEFITKADDVPGGLKMIDGPYASEFAKTLMEQGN